MKQKYTDEEVIRAAKEVKSIAGLLRSLNLGISGSNYQNMKRKLQALSIDTSHWTGQAWNKGEQLKDWKYYTRHVQLKPHLIKKRGRVCESCLLTSWMGNEIPLELHHINGNRTDNSEENLQLLCPNCHAMTANYKNRKQQRAVIVEQ